MTYPFQIFLVGGGKGVEEGYMVPNKNILLIKLEMIFITFGDSVDPQPHQKYWTQCDQNLDFVDRAES